jgi:DNA polymerase III alpha subunit
MINLALRSEFTFQKQLARVKDIVDLPGDVVSIADESNTYAHAKLHHLCQEENKKPIYGVRVTAVVAPTQKVRPRGQFGPEYILLAKNYDGLVEINKIVQRATSLFYYRPQVGLVDVWGLSDNVIVISQNFSIDERVDYLGVSFDTPKTLMDECELPRVALQANRYLTSDDRNAFQIFAFRKKGVPTYPAHLLTQREWMVYFNDQQAVDNTHLIADQCNCELKYAPPVVYTGKWDLEGLCRKGAKELKVDLDDPVYKKRLEGELEVIRSKDFEDYFLIVADMTQYAKESMLVGPGRGSSGGSLVCYLTKITTMDPIKMRLLFERFIAAHRTDMPDIDIDFPDRYRHGVIDHLVEIYGEEKVRLLGTVSQMKTKITLNEFAKNLMVPFDAIDKVTDSLIVRTSADIRYDDCISDVLSKTDAGKELVEKHPGMVHAGRVENHARHIGVHAAAVIVGAHPLIEYSAINERNNTLMIDKIEAERMNLLKIDVLGLSTLTILQETARLAGFDFNDYYDLDLEDGNVFKLMREGRFRGIFQFEGNALQNLARTLSVAEFEDIVAITALARPGPLHGGSAQLYCDVKKGNREKEFIFDHPIVEEITGFTYGTIVFQEQLMEVLRLVGDMTWEEVNKVRMVVSKRKGKEEFNKYYDLFEKGALAKGISEEQIKEGWDSLLNFGAYGFNRSHAVAYGIVSYWTAWAKCYHPLEFSCAYLNITGDDEPKIKMLREIKEHSGIEFSPVDPEKSVEKWSIVDGQLLGGLTNIKGIGSANAKKIISCRKKGEIPPPGLIKKLVNPQTPFDVLYPCREYWGELYEFPEDYGLAKAPTLIRDVNDKGKYIIVGKLIKKNLRDLNEAINVLKRGGEMYEDNTQLLNMTVEDDTGSIICRINRFDYDRLGAQVQDTGREGTDWYIIKGKIINADIRMIFASAVYCIGDGVEQNVYELEVSK